MYIVYNARTHLDVAKFFNLDDAKAYARERIKDTGQDYRIYSAQLVTEEWV